MVRHAALREIICPDPFGTIPRTHLTGPIGGAFTVDPLALQIIKPGAQNLHCDLSVPVLGFFRTDDDDARWNMGDPHGRVGGVHVLTARAGCAHRVDPQVCRVNAQIDLFRFGQNSNRRGRGMDTATRLGHGDTLDPMNTGFIFQPGKHVVAFDMGNHLFQAAKFGGLLFDDLKRPPLRLCVALVHAQQIPGKQRRLIPAGAGTDFQHRRFAIGCIPRQQGQLQRLFCLWQGRAQTRQLFLGQSRHIGICQHLLGFIKVRKQPTIGNDLLRDRAQVGILLGEGCNILAACPIGHRSLKVLKPLQDLFKAVFGDHAWGIRLDLTLAEGLPCDMLGPCNMPVPISPFTGQARQRNPAEASLRPWFWSHR